MLDSSLARKIISHLAKLSDGSLDKALIAECSNFADAADPVLFLYNLRDRCVRYAASNSFVITAITAVLSTYPPESQEQTEQRHKILEDAEKY